MRAYRVAIGKDKEGFIFPIKIYVNYYFQLNDEFVFSALILKLTTSSSYLILNDCYSIQGFTKSFIDFFLLIDDNLTKELLEKLPLQLFIPDIPSLIKESCLSKSHMEGVKIMMIIPDSKLHPFIPVISCE